MTNAKIGVLCHPLEKEIVREFFELFKTPWEFAVPEEQYEVVLSTISEPFPIAAKVVLYYSSLPLEVDNLHQIKVIERQDLDGFGYDTYHVPAYGKLSEVGEGGDSIEIIHSNDVSVGIYIDIRGQAVYRFGYDLFEEIQFLLMTGQSSSHALAPTVELHIELLRNCLLRIGIAVIEIPPVPAGYSFFGCLTHDVDFAGIRYHKLGHTFWGFVYRSLLLTPLRFIQRELSIGELFQNWWAVIKLPFIYLGMAEDIWDKFDIYGDMESPYKSTFFVLPFENRPGVNAFGEIDKKRAANYSLENIASKLKKLSQQGMEIAVHGIDAWRDVEAGSLEMERISTIVGEAASGVRMHWLYHDEDTFSQLEQAGYSYDSTGGYNDAVGYRNGTTQVFKPLGVSQIYELPMHIQDTSLFYPKRMKLSNVRAKEVCDEIIAQAKKFGGVLTISWHARSLAPERLWGRFYSWLLERLKVNNAWIGSAKQIVDWFKYRRAIQFHSVQIVGDEIRIEIETNGVAPNDRSAFVKFQQGNPFLSNLPVIENMETERFMITDENRQVISIALKRGER